MGRMLVSSVAEGEEEEGEADEESVVVVVEVFEEELNDGAWLD